MDTRERNQVRLELGQIDIQGTVETETGGNGTDDLSNQTVQVLITRAGNIQLTMANVIDGLIVNKESAIGVLNGAVGGQDGVVGLDHSSGYAGGRVNGELQLGFLAVFGSETLEQESTKAGAGTTAEGVEDQETLQGGTVVWQHS